MLTLRTKRKHATPILTKTTIAFTEIFGKRHPNYSRKGSNRKELLAFFDDEKASRSGEIHNVSGWMLSPRKSVGLSDMNAVSCPGIHERVDKLLVSDASNSTVCMINQKQTLWKACNRCGPQTVGELNTTPNFIVRVAVTSLPNEHRDDLSG